MYMGMLLGMHTALESCDNKDRHMTMEKRLVYVVALLVDSADKHNKEIEAAQAKMADLHSAVESCANKDHHMSLEEHLACMEILLADFADKHGKDMNRTR